jgi:hypothetical protein
MGPGLLNAARRTHCMVQTLVSWSINSFSLKSAAFPASTRLTTRFFRRINQLILAAGVSLPLKPGGYTFDARRVIKQPEMIFPEQESFGNFSGLHIDQGY